MNFHRKIRSYVRRNSRMTDAQRFAYDQAWPKFGLLVEDGIVNFEQVFQRTAPRILEVGFGSGQSLLAMAKMHPEYDYMGVETHLPGVGALLLGTIHEQLNNIRVYHADVVEVLEKCIPEHSLECVQIFFPDPWQKRRHHKRRLIQNDFINLVTSRLNENGMLHLATDWQHYAEHMMKVLSAIPALINLAGPGQFSDRSSHRPIITKFEQRGIRSSHQIWELQFKTRG